MEILQCEIKIGDYSFDFVNQLEGESAWESLTDTVKIYLPASLKVDADKLKSVIPKGSPVTIKVGYESTGLQERFSGFVARVNPKVPIEIECEDLMWKMKQIQIKENAKNETMKSYLERVLPVEVDCFEIQVPSLVAYDMTGAQLLDKIKQDYGFACFFRNGKLVVGKQYDAENNSEHILIIDNASNCNVKSHDLQFMTKDDLKLKVTAISNMADGSKEEYVVGPEDGESRTLNFYDIPASELKAIAEKEMERLNYDGYRGSVTLFGAPFVQHGDVVEIRNEQESDKTGRYFVDGVTYRFGVNGYEQVAKIGSRA